MDDKKNRILCMKQYLEEYAEELHPVTVTVIIKHLDTAGVQSSCQTVIRELGQLTATGVDVVCNTGKPSQYFFGDRHSELPELRLLIDAVSASRFIPSRKASALIKKLSAFASVHQSGELRRSLYTDKQARSAGDKAYFAVDLLHTAQSTGKKIVCKYFD